MFVKVFDESRGYYGNQGHVARFERDLDNRGQYEAFKAAYARIAGRDWAQGREEGVLEELNVAEAYAEVSGQAEGTLTDILTKYRNEYSVSIEDFADEVKVWLDKQEPDFRLNFYVDEVGQFIGSNTHLMLNLQTIAGVAEHQVPGPGVGIRHLAGGHGQGRRRPHQAAGQRLLQDPGPVQDPREAHQR